jgi:hypothetical protein
VSATPAACPPRLQVTGTYPAVRKALQLVTDKIRDCLGRGVVPMALQPQQQGMAARGQQGGGPQAMSGMGGLGIGLHLQGPRPPMVRLPHHWGCPLPCQVVP